MGRKTLSVEEQYSNAKNKIEKILHHHGPREQLVTAWNFYNNKSSIDANMKHRALICGKLFRYQRVLEKLRKQHPTIIQSYTFTTTKNQKKSTNQTDNTAANEDTLDDNEEPHDQNDNDTAGDDTPIGNATNQVTPTNHQVPLINEQANDDAVLSSCQNCFRKQSPFLIEKYGHESSYNITFIRHRSDEIKRRPFTTVQRTTSNQNLRTYTLCSQCSEHLVSIDIKNAKSSLNSWPAFLWFLLKDPTIQSEYGDKIWRFIPIQWRYWWISAVQDHFPTVFNNISIDVPSSIFLDRTNDILQWNDDIQSFLLSRLSSSCNQFLIPTVLCPWGCTEYTHQCGHIAFDIIFQRYLPKCLIKMIEPLKFNHVVSAREDYIRDEGDEDILLFNPKWKVQPSIAFIEGKGPCVLSCRDHDFGSKFFMVHPCRQPNHILPADRSDQLCHAVIKSRTIKPLKSSTYSNSFQMHTQKGTFNGIDTCSVTFSHKFDKCSKLSSEIVSRSITNRPDINAHVNNLVKDKIISNFAAIGLREEALRISQSIDYKPFWYGSTFVPLKAAMTFQDEINNEDTKVLIDDRDENLDDIIQYFKKSWPSCIFPCQILNEYGARFPSIPKLTSNLHNTKMLWKLSALLTHSETLWQLTTQIELRTSRWHGWLLMYLTKQCFPNIARRREKKDPFKICQIRHVPRLAQKLHYILELNNFSGIFSDCQSILCIDLATEEDEDDMILIAQNGLNNNHQVLIIDTFCQNINGALQSSFDFNGSIFRLQIILRTWMIRGGKWDAEVYSRHENMSGWWYQKRHDQLARHSSLPNDIYEDDNVYSLVYVRVQENNITSLGSQFLKYLGGQNHVRCAEHRLPLITSTKRAGKCNCNRKESYCCSQLGCKVCICQTCFESHDDMNIIYIEKVITDNIDAGNDNDDEDADNDNDSLEEPRPEPSNHEDRGNNIEDQTQSQENDNNENVDGDIFFNDDTYTNSNNVDAGGDENDILQRDDFDDFVTSSFDPDIPNDGNDEDQNFDYDPIPTTNAGEFAYEVHDEMINSGTFGDMVISGHVLLNQCGTLLTRKKHQIKGSSKHKFFLQRICATTIGTSIPLLYPEAMVFPSIFWKMADNTGSIAGAFPAPLLTESIKKYGFQSCQQHVRSRLTSSSSATSTDPRYIAYCYDKLTNLSVNHNDVRIVMNRGLTACEDESGGLGLRGKGDSALLQSIDSKQMVKNLCSSQKFHKHDFFLTFTCNQKKHFGVSPIKNWIDSNEWTKHYPDYDNLNVYEKEEIEKAVLQASGGLLLRNWQEVCKLFLQYLRKSPSSPYQNVLSIFARNEYQKEVGNLSHIHLMLQIDWELLNESQTAFVKDLIRASILDIVRSDEIGTLINDGIFQSIDDHKGMIRDAESFLPHKCNSRCQAAISPGVFRCRKLNNLKVTTDNTKHVFKPLPNDYSTTCIDRLIQIGLIAPLSINEEGYQRPFKSSISFFHPARHIPPTNPTNDMNISPVEGYTFSACRSMQNAQMLTECGGVNKYVCKYIGKIDEQNYIVVSVDGKQNGSLITKSSFLHNTKITSSKINEDKERESKREHNRVQGRAISQMEMLHVMLKYPEVYTDLNFVAVPTMPLELRAGIDIDTQNYNVEDGAYAGIVSNEIRLGLDLPEWRQHSANEILILEDLKMSKVSVDRISQFSIRPPEFRMIFDYVGQYYRWFSIVRKKLNPEEMNEKLSGSLEESCWIDGLQRQVRVRRKALPEISHYLDNEIEPDTDTANIPNDAKTIMLSFFRRIIRVIQSESNNEEVINDDDALFLHHIKSNLIDEDGENQDHLPVPVYSYIKPTMGVQFLHHVMLSMGRFTSEIDLTMHGTIRECLRFSKLIGPSNEPDELQHYSNLLLKKFIVEQMIYFPNSKRVIDSWIVAAGELFDSVIVHDKIPISDMPPVQQTSLFASIEENRIQHKRQMRSNLIDACFKELGNAVNSCNIPSKDLLESSTKESPIEWNAIESYTRNPSQSINSFNEQKLAIQTCIDTINSYCNILNQDVYTKNIGIRGFPGSGKTWIMLYIGIYCVAKGLTVTTTAMMSKRSIHLGGKHWHYLFCLPTEKNLTPHRVAELALCKILKDPKKLDTLLTLDVLLCDEMGQVSAEFLSIIDIIMRQLRSNNIFLGGLLIICTLDHTQIQPVQGRPFLTSTHIIPCFKMVSFGNSIRASGDAAFQRIQELARFNYNKFEEEPDLIDEFVRLVSENFTFVDNWNDEQITPSTYRLYGRRVPAKEAARQFIERVRRSFEPNQLREKKAEDVQKHRRIHREWAPASELTSGTLEQILKEPELLLFFRGAIFECTYNVEGQFSQSQMALLFDLPSQDDLNNWRKIKILIAPPGMTDIEFDSTATKASYIAIGFIEVKIGIAPERTQAIKGGNIQAQRKQYGLKHRVTGTIHAAMGDTLFSMATEISTNDPNFRLWDKGQLVVILSRTKFAKNTIFVGDKDDTIAALKDLLIRKTQWTDYMEQVLELITINSESETHHSRTINQVAFPFRICDIALPQCRTGYVYMLMSIRQQNYTYIGQTICIRTRIQQHNSGYGSTSTQPTYLRPFAILAYICGFGGRKTLREHVEYQWKLKRDQLVRNGINETKQWAECGRDVINEITLHDDSIVQSDLTLVLLF